MKSLLVLVLVGLLAPAAVAQTHSANPAVPPLAPGSKTASSIQLLRDDPLLQVPVTLDAVEQPLGDVLAKLNPVLKLDLTAEQNVADQRVTLHIVGLPAYVLMTRLLFLLSHSAEHPYGYHWGSLERAKGERPDYQLWRDTTSLAQEQAERDYPRRQIAVMLRAWRHMAQLSPKELAAYHGDSPYKNHDPNDLYNKVFRTLTDGQIDVLVSGETVFLDPALYAPDMAAYHQSLVKERADREAHGKELDRLINGEAGAEEREASQPPLPPIKNLSSFVPALRVLPAHEDGVEPDKPTKYYVYLDDIEDSQIVIDPYVTPKDPDPEISFLNLPPDTGTKVDLSPYLVAKTVTPQQKADLGFNLQALAKAAHINVCAESFLGTSFQFGQPHSGLTALQGSVPRLVAQICAVWNYHAYPMPGGYLFWSQRWAQDRASDVPERLIAPWRQRLTKNEVLNFYDRAEIASALTWPQVALTVNPALFPDNSQREGIETIQEYQELNLFGSLTPFEQTQALSPDGLAVSGMSARGQEALASDYRSSLINVPGDQLMQAALHFRTEDAPEINIQRLIMEVSANGQHLVESRCIRLLKADETSKSVTAAGAVKSATD